MACRKYKLFNTGSTLTYFNYQRCDDALWEYQISLKPNEIKNIWLLENTFSSAFGNQFVFLESQPFPPNNPTPTQTTSQTPTTTPTQTTFVSFTSTPTPTNTSSITPTQTPTPTSTPTPTNTTSPTPTQTPTSTSESILPQFTIRVNTNLDYNVSFDVDGSVYELNWGDGSPIESGNTFTYSHVYGSTGVFDITFRIESNSSFSCVNNSSVTDIQCLSNNQTQIFTVYNDSNLTGLTLNNFTSLSIYDFGGPNQGGGVNLEYLSLEGSSIDDNNSFYGAYLFSSSLKYLNLSNTQIFSMDYLFGGNLQTLLLTGTTSLNNVQANNNSLSAINLTNSSVLTLNLENNNFGSDVINDIFVQLDNFNNPNGSINLLTQPEICWYSSISGYNAYLSLLSKGWSISLDSVCLPFTPTPTPTQTETPSQTPSNTVTPSNTETPTQTPTFTPTPTTTPLPGFISVWRTTSPSETIVLPYLPEGVYSGTIYWGDGTTSANSLANTAHTYSTAGDYTVRIDGGLSGFSFSQITTSRTKIREIHQWGPWKGNTNLNVGFNFSNCTNLNLTNVIDTPNFNYSEGQYLNNMFAGCESLTKINKIENWNFKSNTDLSGLFIYTINFGFNQDLNSLNTSNVTNMSGMFINSNFSGNISSWNTSGVTDMSAMFQNAIYFNNDLSGWCVSQIPSTPSNFSTGAVSWVLPKPNWGSPC